MRPALPLRVYGVAAIDSAKRDAQYFYEVDTPAGLQEST